MPKKLKYEHIPLIPEIVAEKVCNQVYTGYEMSSKHRSSVQIEEVEALRQKMKPEDIKEFANQCEIRCKAAFEIGADWFMKCVQAKDNRGRNQLYMWTAHWLAGYLLRKEKEAWTGRYV